MDVNCHKLGTFLIYSAYQRTFFHIFKEYHRFCSIVVLGFKASLSIAFV